MASEPITVAKVFKDYRGRRTALIHALTKEVDNLYELCDPDKDNLCLYGHPNGTWEVALPKVEIPVMLPEPTLGINFARDGIKRNEWLSLVAAYSDSWKRLFSLINRIPTVLEVVNNWNKDKSTVASGSKSQESTKTKSQVASTSKSQESTKTKSQVASTSKSQESTKTKSQVASPSKSQESTKVFTETISCGSCGGNYNAAEFWIGCDICEWWFHGKCAMITPEQAEKLQQYKCPSCALRKDRL